MTARDFINTSDVTVDRFGDVVLVGATHSGLGWRGETVPRLDERGEVGLETLYVAKAPGVR
jgi:hypothetical protein